MDTNPQLYFAIRTVVAVNPLLLHTTLKSSNTPGLLSHIKGMPSATATFNGKVIAKADSWETVEGNVYVNELILSSGIKANDTCTVPTLVSRQARHVRAYCQHCIVL